MPSIEKIIKQMQANPHDVCFEEAVKVCCKFFGRPRQTNGSHVVFKTPWQGDPRINIQNKNGKAKTYQIRQILAALDKLKTSEEP
ncbi:toxin HicA [Pusillimonas sp. ANT_WB101]|uniref:toxin HicA n=1 Tax=Pusillimonas sp. ANT_WB101 TaxID=2597356 RepID=UPI0011EDAB8E|nr:toxin HicA [Pusillimonas sp. ANT_WB101]KAA0889314.1 toxin HicA [Pusillimonas sp. ANT_WB101]